jgi:hypothetical protein
VSGRRAAPGGPSYAWSRRSATEGSAFRPEPEVYPFGSPGEFGPSVLMADRVNGAFPALAPQAPAGSAPWADVKPAPAPHPGTRREARERERQQGRPLDRGRAPVESGDDTRADTGPRPSSRGIAVNTTRALVLAGLIAGGYTQVAGMGGTANAEDTEPDTSAALGAMVVDVQHSDFVREPQVDERPMLEKARDLKIARTRAAALAAKKRAEVKARAAAEAKARAAALERATREANRNPKDVARLMVEQRGWSSDQFSCLDKLWTKESGWNYRASNSSSGAYGIPQALPGSKMGTVADDWRTNAVTQITWGLNYIADRYGTPCGAWSHSVAHNWY